MFPIKMLILSTCYCWVYRESNALELQLSKTGRNDLMRDLEMKQVDLWLKWSERIEKNIVEEAGKTKC